MRLTLTATYGGGDLSRTRLCVDHDPTRVLAAVRTDAGLRLEPRDAASLARVEGPALDLDLDGRPTEHALSPDGRRFAVVTRRDGEGTLVVIDRARGDRFTLAWGRAGRPRMLWSRDGGRLALIAPRRVLVVDVATGAAIRDERPSPPWCDWDGAVILAEVRDEVTVLDDATGEARGRWAAPWGWSFELAFVARDGGFWALCSPEKGASSRSPRLVRVSRHGPDGRELASAEAAPARAPFDAWAMGDACVLFGEWGVGALFHWDAASASLRVEGPPDVARPATRGTVTLHGVSPDGARFVGQANGVAYHVDLAEGRAAVEREGAAGFVTGLARSPDGRWIAATWRGGVAAVLEADSLAPEWTFEHADDWLEACAFAPDGRRLYTLTERALHAWDLARGAEVAAAPLDGLDNDLRGVSLDLWSLAVSPDGGLAFALGRDRDDEDDVAVTFDLARFEVRAMGNPAALPAGVAGPAWRVHTLAAGPLDASEIVVRAVDPAARAVVASFAFADAAWEGPAPDDALDYGWLVLPAEGEVAVFDPEGAARGADSAWAVRWDLRAGSLRAARGRAGYTLHVAHGLAVRAEELGADRFELVVLDAGELSPLACFALGPRERPTEALVTPDRRAVFVGLRRGAVLRFSLDAG